MTHKSLFKLVAGVMLAVSVATIPAVCFTEPALAASKKKKTKKTKKAKVKSDEDYIRAEERESARLVREFVRREKIPKSVVKAGDIYIITSYGNQFKAIQGEGAAIYSEPNFNSKMILGLNNGAKLIAEADYVSHSGGGWYYVHFGKRAKGWVFARYINYRDPD